MMKEEGAEWISISDFMASTIAILIMIVVSLLSKYNISQSPKLPVQKIVKKVVQNPNLHVRRIKTNLADIYFNTSASGNHSMTLGNDSLSIIFESGTFDSGCPCLKDTMQRNIDEVKKGIFDLLNNAENRRIIIEVDGFTDSVRVSNPKTLYCNGRPYLIDDNLKLSMYRAIEARAYLIDGWLPDLKNRVTIGGSGSAKQDPAKGAKNRRIVFKLDSL